MFSPSLTFKEKMKARNQKEKKHDKSIKQKYADNPHPQNHKLKVKKKGKITTENSPKYFIWGWPATPEPEFIC